MNKKQQKTLIRIIVTCILLGIIYLLPISGWERLAAYIIPYGIIGYDVLRKAVKGIGNRQVFDENFLMAVATVGALALAVYEDGDYTEAIAVMLFYQIGELFQSYAVGKSRRKRTDGYSARLCQYRNQWQIGTGRSGRSRNRYGYRRAAR